MLEAIVSASIAVIAAGAAFSNKIHARINSVHDRVTALDRRIDGIELHVAQEYVSKTDLQTMIDRMEDHMVRIETKLDQIVFKNG